MALGLTQPLTEISARNISWGVKAAGAYGREPYHLHELIVLKSGRLNLLESLGTVQTRNGTASHKEFNVMVVCNSLSLYLLEHCYIIAETCSKV